MYDGATKRCFRESDLIIGSEDKNGEQPVKAVCK